MADTLFSAGTVVASSWLNDVNAAVYKFASNPVVNTFASYVYGRSAEEIASGITPTVYAYPRGDIRRYGATYAGSAAINTPAIQQALDSGHGVYIPNGTWPVNASLNLNDNNDIVFESRNAVLSCNMTTPLFQGKNGTTERRYHITIWGGKLYGTTRANVGSVAIDFKSVSMAKVFGTFISEFETAVKIGGTGSLGSFYNELHGVDISGVVTGIEHGTLGNDSKVFGGRVNDSVTGTRDNDCSGNLYCGLAVEAFTTRGHLNADALATTNIKYMFSRLENVPTSGIGIDIRALAQVCSFMSPQFVGLTTNISDASASLDTYGWSDDGLVLKSGTSVKRHLSTLATIDFPSIAAGSSNDQLITLTGALATDSVFATANAALGAGLVCCAIPASGGVYVRLVNVTAAPIDPPSLSFRVDAWRH